MSKNGNRRITHTVFVTEVDQCYTLTKPQSWRRYDLGIDAPVFPVGSLQEIQSHERDVVKADDPVDVYTALSPRFLAGVTAIPVTRAHRIRAAAEGQNIKMIPSEGELYIHTMPQTEEVVPNACRALFITLSNVRHDKVAAYAFDRVTGKLEIIGNLDVAQLMTQHGGMRVAQLPEALQLTIDDFDAMEKTTSLHGLSDEPEPSFNRKFRESKTDDGEGYGAVVSFADWDNRFGSFLDIEESRCRLMGKPYSGAARAAYAGWESGHPTAELIADVAEGKAPEAVERVRGHLSKCLMCAYSALSVAVPMLSLEGKQDD